MYSYTHVRLCHLVKRQMSSLGSLSNSLTETNTWNTNWAESSLSMNPISDRQFYREGTDDNEHLLFLLLVLCQ